MNWQIMVLVSAILITVGDIVKKKLLTHEHAMEFLSSRAFFIMIFSFFLLPFTKPNIGWDLLLWVYFASLIMTVGIIYVHKAIRHMKLSVVIPLTNLSPLLVLIAARILLGEKISGMQFLGVLLILVGAYFLELSKDHPGLLGPLRYMLRNKYIHFLIGGLILFAFAGIIDKYTITNFLDPITYLFYIMIFTSFNFLALEWYKYGFKELRDNLHRDGPLVFLAAFTAVTAHLFALSAVSIAPISLIIPLKRLSTMFTTIIGGKLSHEKNLRYKICACAIMILGAVLISI